MSFDRLKRPPRKRKRLLGHKPKPSRRHLIVQNSKPHLSMKLLYFLGIDAAKHKIRAALSAGRETLLLEKDLPATATGLGQLLAMLKERVKEPEQLLLQRLQRVRKALRSSLTNLKKTYVSLLDLQFPELGQLLEFGWRWHSSVARCGTHSGCHRADASLHFAEKLDAPTQSRSA